MAMSEQLAIIWLEGMETLLEWFTGDPSVPNWEATAMNWLIAALVIAAASTGVMALVKVVWKAKAASPRGRIWPRSKAVLFILVGLVPVLISTATAWYLSRDFVNIIAVVGLFKGILLGWVLYLFFMVLSHAWGEWREDLF
jgi:hypothetical protein